MKELIEGLHSSEEWEDRLGIPEARRIEMAACSSVKRSTAWAGRGTGTSARGSIEAFEVGTAASSYGSSSQGREPPGG